jgi:hypothetical protein
MVNCDWAEFHKVEMMGGMMNEEGGSRDVMQERLAALAGFLPLFEAKGFEFGRWHKSQEIEPGVKTLPQFEAGETALAFVRMAYEEEWVLRNFDWPAWSSSKEAMRLRDDRKALAAASPEQLAKLLTVLIRQDRFVEGALNSAYESGLLAAIARRAAVLVEPGEMR